METFSKLNIIVETTKLYAMFFQKPMLLSLITLLVCPLSLPTRL